MSDGRRLRGERRRRALLDATLSLVGREGAGAITHRAVAQEAGLPLAATTYYFSSKGELVREALAHAAASDRDTLEGLATALARSATVSDVADVLAGLAADWLGPQRAALISHYEISLEGARRPDLAAISQEWTDAYVRTLAPTLARLGCASPEHDAWIVVTALYGIVFDELAGPRAGFERLFLRPALERLLRALMAPLGSAVAGHRA